MKSFCLFARAAQCELYGRIGLQLQEQYGISYITHNQKEKRILENLECTGNIYCIAEFLEKNWENSELLLKYEDISIYEKKYNIDTFWRLFYTDRFLPYYNLENSKTFIKLHLAFFEEIFNKEKCNYYINESIAIFSSYLFFEMGKYYDCRYIGLSVPKLNSLSRFVIMDDQYNNNPKLNHFYVNNNFDGKELANAKDVIVKFLAEKHKPEFQKFVTQKPRFSIKFVYYLLRHIWVNYVKKSSIYDYEKYISNRQYRLKPVSNFFKYHFYHKKHYTLPSFNDRYYYYTLHYQPEANTLICAQNYEKQLYTIDLIAKKIPGNSILYVKEHYSHLGHRDKAFYLKLENYPNVKLISPFVDSHDLIKKSLGVIVLTGTIGWEAMFYKKPVYMLGNFWYKSFRYIKKIKNIDELTDVILDTESNLSIFDSLEYQTELEKYIAAFLKSQHEGCYLLSHKKLLSKENVSNIKKGILAEIKND